MGAIYGHDGALWAASTGMERVRYHELLELKNIFNNPKKGFSRGLKFREKKTIFEKKFKNKKKY